MLGASGLALALTSVAVIDPPRPRCLESLDTLGVPICAYMCLPTCLRCRDWGRTEEGDQDQGQGPFEGIPGDNRGPDKDAGERSRDEGMLPLPP